MSVPGIFKLGLVAIMLQISHLDFMHYFTGKGWSSGDSCLDEHLFKVGRLSIITVLYIQKLCNRIQS